MSQPGLPSVKEHRSEMKTLTQHTLEVSDTWGDRIENKDRKNYRCCFQNINGLVAQRNNPKRESIRQFIKEFDIDFYLMAEINVNWWVVSNRHSIHDMTKGWFESQKIRTSFNRHCRTCHTHQPGGTAIITRDGPSHHFDSAGEDLRKLGRWSWQRFRGKKGITYEYYQYTFRHEATLMETRRFMTNNKELF